MKKIIYSGILALALSAAVQTEVSAQTVDQSSNSRVVTRSRARKNTAIGAGAGAATGAIISRKKGKGAVIGGAVGAGAGYLWGRHQNKKKGQIVKVKD